MNLHVYYEWSKKIFRPKTAILLMAPAHDNIGDAAIAVAEIAFLKKQGFNNIVEITNDVFWNYRGCLKRLIKKEKILFLHGGGNMGDLYPLEEEVRRQILIDFPNNPIFVFPQTIYYSNKVNEKNSIKYYNHKNLTLAAREQMSFYKMKELYPDANVLCTPDIVLSYSIKTEQKKRNGIVLCLRNDKESSGYYGESETLDEALRSKGYEVFYTDTMADRMILPEIREKIVVEKINDFALAELIITDRLHGLLLSVLAGTPCIALDNNHGKVKGTYEWISDYPFLDFATSLKDAETKVQPLVGKEEMYDPQRIDGKFELLRRAIKSGYR